MLGWVRKGKLTIIHLSALCVASFRRCHVLPRLTSAILVIITMSPDARHRFCNVVSSLIQRLTCAIYGVLGGVATLGAGFPPSFQMTTGGSRVLHKASFRDVAMTGVATLGVGFRTSCPMASRCSSVPNVAFCNGAENGVATLGVGLTMPYPMAFWAHIC
jgi:hypothetical protein